MERRKKLEGPVTLFAAIEAKRHGNLQAIAFRERRSFADVVRQALREFVEKQKARTFVRA